MTDLDEALRELDEASRRVAEVAEGLCDVATPETLEEKLSVLHLEVARMKKARWVFNAALREAGNVEGSGVARSDVIGVRARVRIVPRTVMPL